jgi:radical SAM superfamily enzyme YgiQ (UPF0313 family)
MRRSRGTGRGAGYRMPAERQIGPPSVGGRFRVALVFPNTYPVGMANLGFQTVCRIVGAQADTQCERVFLPTDRSGRPRPDWPPVSVESGRPLDTFDVVAFAAPFEADYLHLVQMLGAAGIEPRVARRRVTWPQVLVGGTGASLNPEPVAPFADMIFIGEAERALPGILASLRELRATTHDRDAVHAALAHHPGLYLPAAYHAQIDSAGRFIGLASEAGMPPNVVRQWLSSLHDHPTHSRFLTADCAFGEMFLLEISRGCPRQCRFCTAGHFDNPPRHRPIAALLEEAREGLRWSRRVGLVAPSPSDHPDFLALVEGIAALGGEVSPSSIRIDHLSREVVAALVRSGNRSLTLAPEAGSARMRDVISKEFQEPEILAAAENLAAAGINSAKLYMMVGLPGEGDEDVAAIIDLVAKVREVFLPHWRQAGHTGRLTVSLNQFIPKPHTPFQWTPLEPIASVAAKVASLRSAFAALGNVRLNAEGPQQTLVEAILSRADRRAADLLEGVAAASGRWRKILPGWLAETSTDPHRAIPHDAPLPWDHIATGLTTTYLCSEETRGMKGKNNRPCPPDLVGCHKCGVC